MKELHRRILTLALPAVMGNVSGTIVGLVDMVMVGSLGPAAIAAVGLSGNFIWFATSLVYCISVGTTVLTARSFGARHRENAQSILSQSTIATFFLGALVMVVGSFYTAPLLALFGLEKSVTAYATTFLRIIFLASIPIYLSFNFASALRGAGDTKTPMIVDIVVNLVNVLLNYILIFGKLGFPRLGVTGSAIASFSAFTIGLLLYLVIMNSGKFILTMRMGRLNMAQLRGLLDIGIPASLNNIISSVSFLIYIRIIAYFGTAAISGLQIGLRVESFSYMPGMGFAIAATTLVGQSLGARDESGAKTYAEETTKLSILFMGVMGAIMFFFSVPLASLFTREQEAIRLAALYLRITAVSEIPAALWMTLGGAVQGSGDTRFPLYTSAAGLWLFRIPLGYFLGITLGLGVMAAWGGMLIDNFVRAILLYWRFRKGLRR